MISDQLHTNVFTESFTLNNDPKISNLSCFKLEIEVQSKGYPKGAPGNGPLARQGRKRLKVNLVTETNFSNSLSLGYLPSASFLKCKNSINSLENQAFAREKLKFYPRKKNQYPSSTEPKVLSNT